jgi:phospholipase/lecithinase/hemolysin
MLKRRFIAASALILASVAPALAASPYSAIYSFGDSLSDVGNVFLATGGFEPAPPYSNGQFSNGPVWTQVLASKLGLGPLLPSIAGGADYAWGGATTGYAATNNALVPNFQQQVGLFSATNGFVAPASALYTLSIGANDLYGLLGSALTLAQAKPVAAAAAAVVASTAGALQTEGARNLVLFDVPDLGVSPAITTLGAQVVIEAKALSAYFDQQVLLDLKPVEMAGLKVYDLNTFALVNEVVNDPAAFGFTDVTTPCYGGSFAGGGSACATPDEHLFWDSKHPTAAAHAMIGALAFDQVATAPEPSTWVLMLFGFAGLGVAAHRRSLASVRIPGR